MFKYLIQLLDYWQAECKGVWDMVVGELQSPKAKEFWAYFFIPVLVLVIVSRVIERILGRGR